MIRKEGKHKENPCTFGEVLLLWEEVNRLKHKGATEAKYEYLIRKHILPELGDFYVTEIRALTVNNYIAEKLRNGRRDGEGGLSPSYVRSMAVIISSALQFAAGEQLCPPIRFSIYKPAAQKKDLAVLSEGDQAALETFLKEGMDATKLGVMISLYSGMRIGEICALSWDDVDLERGVLRVRNTVARIKDENGQKNGTKTVIDRPKTKASLRDIPIYSQLFPCLEGMRAKAKSSFVVSENTSFTSPRTYEYRYHRILEQCNIERINYHTLRHTFATRCIHAGVDVKTLSEILGHANVAITLNTYVHPSMDMKRAQLEKLSSLTISR